MNQKKATLVDTTELNPAQRSLVGLIKARATELGASAVGAMIGAKMSHSVVTRMSGNVPTWPIDRCEAMLQAARKL